MLREVLEEYRGEWRAFYVARKNGAGSAVLQEMRTSLILRQQKALRERRDVAGAELCQARRDDYLALLERQSADRADISARRTGYAANSLDGRRALSDPKPGQITPTPVSMSMSRTSCVATAEMGGERTAVTESRRDPRSAWIVNGRWRHSPYRDVTPLSSRRWKAAAPPPVNSGSRIRYAKSGTISRASLSVREVTVLSNEPQHGAGQPATDRVQQQRTSTRLCAEATSARAVALALLFIEYGQKLAAVQQQFLGSTLEAAFTALTTEKHAAERAIVTKLAVEACTRRMAVTRDDNAGNRSRRMVRVQKVKFAMNGCAAEQPSQPLDRPPKPNVPCLHP